MARLTPRLLSGCGEAAAVLNLIRESFSYMEERINPPSSMTRLKIKDILQQTKTGEVWLLGDRPDGVMFLTPKPNALYPGKLAIHKNHRGQGYAGVLVEQAMTRAASLGFDSVELQTRVELVENHSAFEAMGFCKTGEISHAGYDRTTTIHYRREVNSSLQLR